MMVARSREADSGVCFVQKYFSAFRPTTGIPCEARTWEMSRSIAAQPPSPETKTTSVSEVPRVAGTSTSGRVAADTALAERKIRRIAYFIRAREGPAGGLAVFGDVSPVIQGRRRPGRGEARRRIPG